MRKPMDVKRYFPGGLIAEWRAQAGEAPGGVWRVLLDLGGRPIRSGDGKRAREAAKKMRNHRENGKMGRRLHRKCTLPGVATVVRLRKRGGE